MGQGYRGQAAYLTEPAAPCGQALPAGLVTTSQWALGTAARTAAMFGTGDPVTGDPGTGEPRAAGPLRLLPGDLPQGR